jgi:hypothetical protein
MKDLKYWLIINYKKIKIGILILTISKNILIDNMF